MLLTFVLSEPVSPLLYKEQEVLRFRVSTCKNLNSTAKVTFFFDIAKQFDIFFFIFLIFYAKKHIFARFLSSEYGKMQKNVLKSQALGRDATPDSVRQAPSFICNVLCLQP